MKADLHIHSIYSYDAISKPETILEIAAERGLDMIAITDHNAAASWKHFEQTAKKYPVHVIRGQEIRLYSGKYVDGEILALFIQKPIVGTTMSDVHAEIKSQRGLTSIAASGNICHRPWRDSRRGWTDTSRSF